METRSVESQKQQSVLLVDDDPVMRELAEAKLVAAGYATAVADNGAAALARLKKDRFDLVISDLQMPEMDGYELTSNIRLDAAIAETPVIVITGSDHEDAVERAFAAGATSFLAKPINWTLFGQAVKFVLRASEQERALRVALNRAEAGARFKDNLLSVMSHELRTPLNAIIGFGKLLVDRCVEHEDKTYREYAEYIVDGGHRLLNTISDMLLASDARSGPISINEADTTIGLVVEQAKALASAALKSADLTVKLDDPDLEFCADGDLIARAVAKLIDNAAKFSPSPAKIMLGAGVTKRGELAILVKDFGAGIPKEKLEALTAPFVQSDMSVRRSKEGLGLGLPLVQSIARAHGAAFRLSSEVDVGTKAIIVIPQERVRSGQARADDAA